MLRLKDVFFNGKDINFVKKEWDHLTTSLKDISCLYEYKPPCTVNLKLQQAIPTILQSPNYPDTL